MSEQAKKVVFGIIVAVLFVLCVALVVLGQQHIGPTGLLIMMIGVVGLLILLWLYNRQYR